MSGYRSLKRVLGESNLERKCRWLFGACVGGLIVVAFVLFAALVGAVKRGYERRNSWRAESAEHPRLERHGA